MLFYTAFKIAGFLDNFIQFILSLLFSNKSIAFGFVDNIFHANHLISIHGNNTLRLLSNNILRSHV